jgi:hypothetical protein
VSVEIVTRLFLLTEPGGEHCEARPTLCESLKNTHREIEREGDEKTGGGEGRGGEGGVFLRSERGGGAAVW